LTKPSDAHTQFSCDRLSSTNNTEKHQVFAVKHFFLTQKRITFALLPLQKIEKVFKSYRTTSRWKLMVCHM